MAKNLIFCPAQNFSLIHQLIQVMFNKLMSTPNLKLFRGLVCKMQGEIIVCTISIMLIFFVSRIKLTRYPNFNVTSIKVSVGLILVESDDDFEGNLQTKFVNDK